MSGTHNYTFAAQKYRLLQEQHAELNSHLEQIRPRRSSLCSSASTASSPESSANYAKPSFSFTVTCYSPHKRSRSCHSGSVGDGRRGSAVLDTVPDEETMLAVSAEQQRLFNVNQSIKRILTELLNCDIVRDDSSMRRWTQTRLMEAEKELRFGRRRRSCVCRDK